MLAWRMTNRLKRVFNTASRRVLAGLVALLVVVGVIIASVLLTRKSKTEDESKYTATCSHEDYTMWNPMKTCCNVTVPAGDDAGIDVRRTSFFLNSKELPVNCSPRATDGTITCTGPAVTCQFRGILTIAFFDKAGNVVLDKILKLSSPFHPMVTSVVQVFEPVDKDPMSYFNFTCAMTSSCDTVTMALFVAGNRYLTEENASLCINTLMTDRGYNKSCVFEIDEDVIRKQHSIDISCALLQDGGIAMHEKFRLPACSDVSSDCNCSAQQRSCGEICSKVGTCLKHDAASRYQNITTRDPSLVTVCPVLCTPKWCRDTLNGDKTVTVTSEVLQAMCPNS